MKQISQKLKEPRAESRKLNQFISFLKKNYLLLIFVACIGFVGLVSVYKLFMVKPTYIYAKIKVGQGMWWASTQKPALWYVKAIQQAKEQNDLTGKPVAKILDVSYYPYYISGQYDVYVTAQLKVSKVGNKGIYNFNRETIGVSSPIDMEFPNVQFSGTIIALSEKPTQDIYESKIVYLYKKSVNPWEYDQIQIGDSFFNGKEKAFEILDKQRGETNDILLSDIGKQLNSDIEPYRYVRIKAKILVKKVDNQYILGEEYVISPGRSLSVVTNNLTLNDYFITRLE